MHAVRDQTGKHAVEVIFPLCTFFLFLTLGKSLGSPKIKNFNIKLGTPNNLTMTSFPMNKKIDSKNNTGDILNLCVVSKGSQSLSDTPLCEAGVRTCLLLMWRFYS